MFAPLAAAYSRALAEFMDKCQGLLSITKRDFFRLFHVAWEVSVHSKNITKAFLATGLSLLNLLQILTRFERSEPPRPNSSDSVTSVLSASDWRKIEQLLRKVVDDVGNQEVKKLS
jgi:hypothetical protein